LEYALWRITGIPLRFDTGTLPYLSREIAKETGEDPAEVSIRLMNEIKIIVNEDVDRQLRRCRPCRKREETDFAQLTGTRYL
jgi:uncharacterized protein YlzI (FlbEa/FlbD family)